MVPNRTDGVRKIAERFGVNPPTVRAISMELTGRLKRWRDGAARS